MTTLATIAGNPRICHYWRVALTFPCRVRRGSQSMGVKLWLASCALAPAVSLLPPPASSNSRAFFLQGWQLPPCLSAPARAAQRHLWSAGKRTQRDSSGQRRSPARLKEQRTEGKGITGLFNPLFSCLYKGQQDACGTKGKNFPSKSGAILPLSLSVLSERSNFCFSEGSKGVCQGWQKKGRS